jgi:hypothetical protein
MLQQARHVPAVAGEGRRDLPALGGTVAVPGVAGAAEEQVDLDRRVARVGLDAGDPAGRVVDQLPAFDAGGDYPMFARLAREPDGAVDFGLDTLFEFGLARLLDGLTALIGDTEKGRHGRS